MQKQLFRQYDIRGKIGTEIAIDDFYNLMHAILYFFKQQGCTAIVVGMDGRVHSEAIFNQISAACKLAGVDVHFLGVCSTPVTVFAHYNLPVQACLMITASHNPADYNGLKIYYDKVAVEGEKLQQIYELFAKKVIVRGEQPGQFFDVSYGIDQYVDSLVSEFEHLKDFHAPVYIDCGNGTGGPILTRLLEKMGWNNTYLLFEKVDGTYPNHVADPTDIENVQELISAVTNHPSSFGIGLDGDCDRVAVISRDRKLLAADQLLTLFAQAMQAPIIVADIKSSSVLYHAQAKIVLAKTGCANIKTVMTEQGALLGGELSGHFFFKDRHAGYDDGIYGMLRFFEILMMRKISCDELVATLPQSFATKDMRIPCSDLRKFEIVSEIQAQLLQDSRFKITMIDGVRFETVDGWGLIRASNTQPALSVCCEATSFEKLRTMKNLLMDLLLPYIDRAILEQYIL
ncbi:MAG: phosphomannomutase/phosphoglucomutase [Candidatus Chromulinivorax sp.]|nr:phosphomannomutase/phosphoglucomutase [Candidatus Chromulinivorax sp.]